MKITSNRLIALICSILSQGAYCSENTALVDDKPISKNDNVLVVTAELDETNLLELANSVSVIDSETIARNNARHFSDLLNLAPNVNFATGASRGRFVQIRGIGERSEFAEPVNYSVGVVVDGIDMTGIASGATLLDIQQVEILRGPQGTLLGANALAGMINIVSNAPTENFYSQVSAGVEQYGGRHYSAVISDSASPKTGYRLALGHYLSDGYMDNVFLNRDDTNDLNELSFRGKLVHQFNDALKLTSNLFFVDADNGYDAFSLDSNRTTYSDQPGFDRQQTQAAAFQLDWQLSSSTRLEANISLANSELDYAYDEDWSHPEICEGTLCDFDDWGFDWWYSSFDAFHRDNDSQSVDMRLHSATDDKQTSWVVGAYYRSQGVELLHQYTYLSEDFSSDFDTDNIAVYGQIKHQLSSQTKLIGGLRFENRSADYLDSGAITFRPDEDLWGGKISLQHQLSDGPMVYGLISRGYKAGGFNAGATLPAAEREYDTEFLINYETGIKGNYLNNTLSLQAAIFYQDRDDIQSKQSLVLSQATGLNILQGGECPCSFEDYIKNAPGGGVSYGLELESKWRGLDSMHFYATLGLLKTRFDNFQSFTHSLADVESIPPVPYDLSGRAVAHAPEYQFVIGSDIFISEHWTLNAQLEVKDSFYFSDRHNVESDSYQMINLGLKYQQPDWQLNLYIRNLTDEKIQTRGFGSFPNDPRDLYTEFGPYYQFGAPRLVGVSARYEFE